MIVHYEKLKDNSYGKITCNVFNTTCQGHSYLYARYAHAYVKRSKVKLVKMEQIEKMLTIK